MIIRQPGNEAGNPVSLKPSDSHGAVLSHKVVEAVSVTAHCTAVSSVLFRGETDIEVEHLILQFDATFPPDVCVSLQGFLRPELLGNEFTHIEFPRRIQHSELGKKMLYRDHTMTGW